MSSHTGEIVSCRMGDMRSWQGGLVKVYSRLKYVSNIKVARKQSYSFGVVVLCWKLYGVMFILNAIIKAINLQWCGCKTSISSMKCKDIIYCLPPRKCPFTDRGS